MSLGKKGTENERRDKANFNACENEIALLLDLLVLVLTIFDGAYVQRGAIGEDETGGRQPFVPN